MWIYLFASAFVIWIVVRTIHKQTKWLEVEGRRKRKVKRVLVFIISLSSSPRPVKIII